MKRTMSAPIMDMMIPAGWIFEASVVVLLLNMRTRKTKRLTCMGFCARARPRQGVAPAPGAKGRSFEDLAPAMGPHV
jgi:hypothetical protein